MRLLRSGMLEVLDSEYVKLARVKGVVERRVIWMHALKNALIPVVTFAGIYFAILVTTAIVVETVFAWPGLGRLAYEGITSRDFPVIQAVVLTTAAIVAVVNSAWTASTPSSIRGSGTRDEHHGLLPEIAARPLPRAGADGRIPRRLLGIITVFVLAGLLAPLVSPSARTSSRCGCASGRRRGGARLLGPPARHRSSRARHALRILWARGLAPRSGVLTVLLASAFGAAVAGGCYYGGRVDATLMRITDAPSRSR